MPASFGILGGTFDPPHLGHVAAAEAAWRQLGLEQVRVIPAGLAPLREASPVIPVEHRLALCKLAFAALPWAVVDTRELYRPGRSWSVDTARELAAEFPQARRVWILGADQLARLPQWREVEALGRLVEFAVLARDGLSVEVPESIKHCVRLTVLRAPEVKVSSTDLRAALRRGELIRNGLPSEVGRYIDEHHLYRL
jgi:nicotinate-nucleotide adenylyltransferase